MEAEQLAVEITKRLKPILTKDFEHQFPCTYQAVQDVITYCGDVVSSAYIRKQTEKECCSG